MSEKGEVDALGCVTFKDIAVPLPRGENPIRLDVSLRAGCGC